jgi:hypothetical protein
MVPRLKEVNEEARNMELAEWTVFLLLRNR